MVKEKCITLTAIYMKVFIKMIFQKKGE